MADARIKVLYVSGTRADFGLMKGVLDKIRKDARFELKIAATGMHLMPEFGSTISDIKQEGYSPLIVNEIYREDTRWGMAEFVGKAAWRFAELFRQENPSFVLVLGDRGEMLAATIAAAYGGIPVAHFHGGEVTGSIDESVRHAITKLAHIHLAPTKKALRRIIKMGENPWRVHFVGAPSLDTIVNKKLVSVKEIQKKFSLQEEKPTVVVLQHPVVTEYEECEKQMRETMEAVKQLGYQTIVIYPNADAGGKKMIGVIKNYEDEPCIRTFKSLVYEDYLHLLRAADVLVGNSSSGIIEAPLFKLPVVNIGMRQQGREQSVNVVNCDHEQKAIIKAIRKALSQSFKAKAKKCKNVYGDGKAGERVIKILSAIKIEKSLLQKKNMY